MIIYNTNKMTKLLLQDFMQCRLRIFVQQRAICLLVILRRLHPECGCNRIRNQLYVI